MRRCVVLLIILLSLTISCKIPPFNEEISRLVLLTSDMEEEAKVGPVELGDLGMEEISLLKFIPTKDSYNDGFLIVDDTEITIVFITENDNLVGLVGAPFVEQFTDFSNANMREINYVAETIRASGPQMTFININPLPVFPFQRLNVVEFDHLKFPPGEDLIARINGDKPPPLVDLVVSADIYPEFGSDSVFFLCKATAFPNQFYEIRYDTDSTGLPFPGTDVRPLAGPFPVVTFPDAPTQSFYFHYEPLGLDGTSIAQYWIGSGWRTLRWDNFDLPGPPPRR